MDLPVSPAALAALCALAFFAGFVDSVIGGGGLIQVPALLVFLPNVPVATIFGTNKIVSLAGTSVALAKIARAVDVPWRSVLPAALAAAVCHAFRPFRLINDTIPAHKQLDWLPN